MTRFTLLACLEITLGVATCNAAIRFELPEVSVVVSGSQAAVGFIDVIIRADASDLPKNISSFNVDFHTTSPTLALSPAQASPTPLLHGTILNFSTDSQSVFAAEDVFPGSEPLFDGAGLVRVPFQVPFGNSGDFTLQFGSFNELADSSASAVPIQTTDTGFVRVIVAASGDYNHNGVVDAADYVTWRKSLGSSSDLAADGNQNGSVDVNDHGIWRLNFGLTGPQGFGTFSIPEPNSLGLPLIALAIHSVLIRCKRADHHLTKLRG